MGLSPDQVGKEGQIIDLVDGKQVWRDPLPPPAAPISDEQKRLLKQTAGGGDLSDDEFTMFLVVAARLGLDPLVKQIFALHFNNKATKRKEMVILVPIAGQRTACQRAGLDDGMEPWEWTEDGMNWTTVWLDEQNPPKAARCTVYRKGSSHGYSATVTWHEFAKDTSGPGGAFWRDMPSLMLGKCAEALARRMGFSDVLSGVYEPAEFSQMDSSVTVKPKAQDRTTAPAAAPRINQGSGGAQSKPEDDNYLAPINNLLFEMLPQLGSPVTREQMADWYKDGGRTRQFVELEGLHTTRCGVGCAHQSPAVKAALSKLGLAVVNDGDDAAHDGDDQAHEAEPAHNQPLPGLQDPEKGGLSHATTS